MSASDDALRLRITKESFAFNDDRFSTETSEEQVRVEDLVRDEVRWFAPRKTRRGALTSIQPVLDRGHHSLFLLERLCGEVLEDFEEYDSFRPWLVYWNVHSLNLLNIAVKDEIKTSLIRFIKSCEHPNGGYGGGPGQMAHLLPTYAAVLALVSLRSEQALASIDRFLREVKNEDGSFTMHPGGETDMRGIYCALAVAFITQVVDDELKKNSAQWVARCQTYEGGFGGVEGCEAHGGYTHCAVASLALLEKLQVANLPSLIRWLSRRQMRYEGGFQGRTNKHVDGCYSFYQAAAFEIVDAELDTQGQESLGDAFDARALEEYILIATQLGIILTNFQDPSGGLRDKPDLDPDMHHTCYVLSGLSIAQRYLPVGEIPFGGVDSKVEATHPVFNVVLPCIDFATKYFKPLEKGCGDSWP